MGELNRSVAPEIHSIDNLSLSPLTCISLPNGIIFKKLSQTDFPEVCRITVVLPGGLADDHTHNIAHLSVDQLREGTSFMSGSVIADRLESAGAWIKTGASETGRFITLYTLSSQFDETIEILHELIYSPTYPSENLDKSKQRLTARLEIENSKVSSRALYRTREILFPQNNPMHYIDSIERIRSITRDQLLEFHHSHLGSAQTRIYAAGNINSKMTQRIPDIFGKEYDHIGKKINPDLRINTFTNPCLDIVEMKESSQDAVCISIPTIGADHPDYVAMKIAVSALGGYFGSRLMRRIREEKGYTYGINAYVINHGKSAIIRIITECDHRYTTALLDEVYSEMKRLAAEPPRDTELHRLRQNIISGLASNIDSPFAQIIHHILCDLDGVKADIFKDTLQLINNLQPTDISEMAAKYINPHNSLTVIAGKPDISIDKYI